MFSFRTTPLEVQLDKALLDGRVGCFCNQNCFDTKSEKYMYEIFRKRGNLARLFMPSSSELTPGTDHIEFSQSDLEGLDAVVVEIQDVGVRYFNFTRDVMRLLSVRARMEDGPAIYVVDHFNPLGRIVEGTMPAVESDIWTPKVAHRHALTLAELCNLYYGEINAKFPLHVISAECNQTGRDIMPWTIAPSSDLPPHPEDVIMRPCSFTPSAGRYAMQACRGYQIILKPGAQYHNLLHTLEMMRYFAERYSQFEMLPSLFVKVADPVIEEYLKGRITFDIVQEHIKGEEQKWIRKAKRYALYDETPYRIK